MKWLAAAGATVFAVLLLLFLLGDAWQAPLLTDPAAQLRRADPLTALLGVALLVVDAVLPVPASLVMIALGAVFGAVLGTLLAALGTMGATLFGFALGRRGGVLLERHVSPRERERADRLLTRWGALAIVVSRPVPLLAETTAILAGASSLGWERATLAALAGAIPTAVIYALTGAVAAGVGSGALVFGIAVLMTGCAWLADRYLSPGSHWAPNQKSAEPSTRPAS
jgi:uncharacterized membrane protein YdjX (TVP38/TMEM64 family)